MIKHPGPTARSARPAAPRRPNGNLVSWPATSRGMRRSMSRAWLRGRARRPFYEQGNWYRGGAFMMYNINWFWTTKSRSGRCSPRMRHRRTSSGFRSPGTWLLDSHPWIGTRPSGSSRAGHPQFGGAPKKVFDAMIRRVPNDPAWYRGALFHDSERINVPACGLCPITTSPSPRTSSATTSSGKRPKERPPTNSGRSSPRSAIASSAAPQSIRSSASGHGRCAAQLSGDHVRLLGPFPQGEKSAVLDALPKSRTSRWLEQVGSGRIAGRRGRRADDLIPDKRRTANTLSGDGALALKAARRRQSGPLHIRSDGSGAHARRYR